MKRHNLQSVLFVGIVLFFVWWSRPQQSLPEEESKVTANEQISVTSINPTVIVNGSARSFDTSVVQPAIEAKAAVMKQLGDARVSFRHNTNERWPIASLTKLMTAVVALEKFSPNQKIYFNSDIVATEGVAGGFQPGDSFSVREVIRSLMMVSSNDGAMALAEAYGYKNFIEAMQAKAFELGMVETTFVDATGLSFLNQSTIDDLERLVRYSFNTHPEIFQMSTERQATIGGRTLVNINRFAGRADFIGGKTGHTTDAKQNLISLFHQSDSAATSPVLIILLGSDDRFGETEKLWQSYTNLVL